MIGLANEWFADKSFWEVMYPFIFPDAARAAAVMEVAAISSLVGRPIGTVLDLCCGPGRHSVAFAKQGSRVTGVDRSPLLLDRARQYAAGEGVEIRWVQQDMRDFIEPHAFDLVVNLFTAFGYFEDPADNQRVLTNIRASLVAGGAFVLDVVGKEVLARIFQQCRVQEVQDGALLVMRGKVIDDWSRIENDWRVVRNSDARSFRFRHWLYSAVELRQMLADAGFIKIDMFGSVDGASYGVDANRLIVRAYAPR
jgi:SAM-dependent methyltransferase